jgi:ferredoxin
MSERISKNDLRQRAGEWIAAGKAVAGPVQVKPGTVLYAPLAAADALLLDGWIRPSNSIKEFIFPRHEALYGYRIDGAGITLDDLPAEIPEQIIVGAHPCDAAALPILDKLFNWDSRDDFFNRRREATTVITIACTAHDEQCFCTSVGLSPAAERGSDALLVDSGDGNYEVRILSEKGAALFGAAVSGAAVDSIAPDGSALSPAPAAGAPERRFDPAAVAEFAKEHFEDPFWREHALACVGCGACAYTCPVCHCFDIVDEGNPRGGVRARNWDACQFALFTLHSSGHNPRPAQGARQRQRIYHKFFMYPEKFGETLCTGCGNCARNCPVGLGVLPLVSEICHAESV